MFPYERIIIIEKESKIAIYRQIAIALINAISNGTLKAGAHLPSSRELAKRLGVHRKTVIAGYEELVTQDWITIVPKKHVIVSANIPSLVPQKWHTNHISSYQYHFNLPFRTIVSPINKPVPNLISEIVIDDGHPDVRLSPIDELLRTYRSYTSKKHAIKDAHLGTEQGTLSLREELSKYLSETRGLNCSAENILITHGAQMSIYIASRLLLNPHSTIIVGNPNYPVANQTFEETGANLIDVSVDEHGIDVAAIEKICKKRKITAVYVIPHHHYPTAVTLSVERRMRLLELSSQYSFAIIEDDYDYDYHYTSSPYLPLASASHQGNVIYIGSFSKILDPSLRIGFMVAPKNFIDQCTTFRKIVDVGGDGYMQNALASLIKGGELKRHLKKAKKIYHQRRDILDQMLQEKLSKYVSYSVPTGGMSIWIKIRADIPVMQFLINSKLKIIRIDENQNAFRFGFASMDEKEIKLAVSTLEKLILPSNIERQNQTTQPI